MLYTGPSLLLDLVDIIMRYKYVFVVDIEKMFRQILVDPRDRHLQTVLWRDKIEKLISLFIFNTLTYGLGPSPFLAIRSLQQLAMDFGHLFPLAIMIILKESYCDDFASGADTIEEAKSKQIDLIGLCKVGGFELGGRKWAANSPELENCLPKDHLLRDSSFFESQDSTSILGLSYSTQLVGERQL